MIERPDVDQLLAGPLGEWLARQAQVREEARAKSNRRFAISAIVLVPLLGLMWFATDWGFKLWATIGGAAAAGFWSYSPKAAAIEQTKHGINAALAEALGLQYTPEFEPGIAFERAKAFEMFPGHDRSKFEDLWSGELAGLPFNLHEVHLEEQQGSGKNRRYVTVFRGPVMTIGFTRAFHGTTLVARAGMHRNFGLFGNKDSIDIEGRQLDFVDMVHPEFEDQFSVYSTDQVEARYLVHPTYVERLLALEQAFAGREIRTLFHQGELTIVVEADDMFESGNLDAERDRELIETCVWQLTSMAELADSLNEPAR